MTTLAEALLAAAAQLAPSPTAQRDAELLLFHAAHLDKAALLTHPERELTERELNHYHAALTRRAAHEPVQYILGYKEFYARPFIVNPLVLIPRPETERLVEAALEAIRAPHPAQTVGLADSAPLRILDVGTGSGILAVTLALELPHATVTATDISPAPLAVAQANARALGAAERIRFLRSDLFAAIGAEERFQIVVSNPPYVAAGEMLEPQVRDYEPAAALYAGPDGLAIYRRLIPDAHQRLAPGGLLLLEIGYGQRDAVAVLLTQAGYQQIRFADDLQGIPRVAIARVRGPVE